METYSITDFAMYLVKTNRAKDVTTAGKRVRSALRSHKSDMAKVDKSIKAHQKGATYSAMNKSSATILANALNITNVSALKRSSAPKKRVKKVVTPNVVTVASDS